MVPNTLQHNVDIKMHATKKEKKDKNAPPKESEPPSRKEEQWLRPNSETTPLRW
jgi:hypothetical protein